MVVDLARQAADQLIDRISATTTETGLTVICELDHALSQERRRLGRGIGRYKHRPGKFHGEWNATVKPPNRSDRAANP